MDFAKIENLVNAFIEEKYNAYKNEYGESAAIRDRLPRDHALEITMLCLRHYHEQAADNEPQHDEKTPV